MEVDGIRSEHPAYQPFPMVVRELFSILHDYYNTDDVDAEAYKPMAYAAGVVCERCWVASGLITGDCWRHQ